MKCYNCGATLSSDSFCTACGADVKLYKEIIFLSNAFYNDGLNKARVRDLSGAVVSLEQSLKCNKNNIDARNLLGLVYFEMGEAVSALSEWVISKSIQANKNIANDFIEEIQENSSKLSALDQTIRKYNIALDYSNQDAEDLAVIQLKKVLSVNPNMISAYLLLGLLYLHASDWKKAKKTLEKALTIDRNNTRALLYLKEADEKLEEQDSFANAKRKTSDSVTFTRDNEVIIQPLNGMNHTSPVALVNMLMGVILGIGVMWFLILPARIQSAKSDMNTQLKEVSEQLTTRTADIDGLNKQIETLSRNHAEAEQRLLEYTGNSGLMQDYNTLLRAALNYIEDSDDSVGTEMILREITTVSDNSASEDFLALYDYLSGDVSKKAVEQLMESGMKKYNKRDYSGAASDLENAYMLDPENDQALYYLGMSYIKDENETKGREYMQQLLVNFPDSDYKSRAQSYIDRGEEDDEEAPSTKTTTPTPEPTLPSVPDTSVDMAAIIAAQQAAAAQAAAAQAAGLGVDLAAGAGQ